MSTVSHGHHVDTHAPRADIRGIQSWEQDSCSAARTHAHLDQCQVSDSVCTHARLRNYSCNTDMQTLDVCVDLESYPCLQHVMFPGQAVWL
jgi:hypothetical protein